MEFPWWQKLLDARFKDGKYQLAHLLVYTSSSQSVCVACLVPGYEAHLCSRSAAWSVPIGDQSAACKTCSFSKVQTQSVAVTEH
jgi:hypothetical protein